MLGTNPFDADMRHRGPLKGYFFFGELNNILDSLGELMSTRLAMKRQNPHKG